MKLNRKRPYGESRDASGVIVYEQDGVKFLPDGTPIEVKKAPDVVHKPERKRGF